MKILQIHNSYRFHGGEERVYKLTVDLLKSRGHIVSLFEKNSKDLKGLYGKIRAFKGGVYSRTSINKIIEIITENRPDIVHIHNLYPLISPSILPVLSRHKLPVLMTCHNFRLTCPIGVHLHGNQICDRCLGGREYWCVLKNCRNNIFESIAFSIRATVGRKFRLFKNNVTGFVSPADFLKRWLKGAGFKGEHHAVIPNMVSIPDCKDNTSKGEYAAYVGRISPEKGIDTILAAASHLPELPVKIAGEGPLLKKFSKDTKKNISFLGLLDRRQILAFYRKARFIIIPSKCFEVCPLVISEAMSHGLPVLASDIGALPEIVDDKITGLLFEVGNEIDLRRKMKLLWDKPELCKQMGQAGRHKAINEYSEDVYYTRLMNIYEKCIHICKDSIVKSEL